MLRVALISMVLPLIVQTKFSWKNGKFNTNYFKGLPQLRKKRNTKEQHNKNNNNGCKHTKKIYQASIKRLFRTEVLIFFI